MIIQIFGQADVDKLNYLSKEQITHIIKALWGSGEGYRFYVKTFKGIII